MQSARVVPHDEVFARESRRRRICCVCNGHRIKDHPTATVLWFNFANVLIMTVLFEVLLIKYSDEYTKFQNYFPIQSRYIKINMIFYYTSLGFYFICALFHYFIEDPDDNCLMTLFIIL